MHIFSNRSQMASKCVDNISVRLACASCAIFVPHFDVNYDLLLNRQTHSSMESLYRNDVFSENIFRFKEM